jgi:tRNA dimethylallyltransferase
MTGCGAYRRADRERQVGRALALAEQIGGTIVNTDSMQVYREARILTARPSDEDMARVPHLLYGHVSVHEPYSVARYQADAAKRARCKARREARADFRRRHGALFRRADGRLRRDSARAGGHSRKARALRGDWARTPSSPSLSRAIPKRACAPRIASACCAPTKCSKRPVAARALAEERGTAVLGRAQPRALRDLAAAAPSFTAASMRASKRCSAGAADEAAALEGLDPALPAAKILGLRELAALRAGTLDPAAAKAAAQAATRQYAKRQLTWFRHRMADWHWIEAKDLSNILAEILSHLHEIT